MAHECFKSLAVSEEIQSEFRSGMNSLVYRFKSCTDSAKGFSNSLSKFGAAPAQPERYIQERNFYSFIVTGVTCYETLCFALFAWGAALYPGVFSFASEREKRRVSPGTTSHSFDQIPEGRSLAAAIRQAENSSDYERWTTLRRVMFHRGLPGRLIVVGPEDARTKYHPFADLGGIEAHPDTIDTLRQWLAKTLSDVMAQAVIMMDLQRPRCS